MLRLLPLLVLTALAGSGASATWPCAPGAPAAKLRFCNRSLGTAARTAALVDALPVGSYGDQLTGRQAPLSNNVSSLGLDPFDFWHEACHGLLQCGVCNLPASAGQAGCDETCPAAPTAFPQVIGLAASFNASLWHLIGAAISTEARSFSNLNASGPQSGLNFWAPNMNVQHDPRWGRAQETPGESVLINGDYAVNFVRGMQEGGDSGGGEVAARVDRSNKYLKVGATCKHAFAYSLDGGDTALHDGRIDRHHFNAIISKQVRYALSFYLFHFLAGLTRIIVFTRQSPGPRSIQRFCLGRRGHLPPAIRALC